MQNLDLARGDRPMVDALLEAPYLGLPDSTFIYPMVAQGAPAAARLLADVHSEPVAALHALTRVAAWSMLQDTAEHAPYGWTHCLTIPQAVKYTLASFDAAAADPDHSRLYFAAASYLAEWWSDQPDDGFYRASQCWALCCGAT